MRRRVPAGRRRSNWPWKWQLRSCIWKLHLKISTLATYSWPRGPGIWRNVWKPSKTAGLPSRWNPGWKIFIGVSVTSKPWAVWWASCGYRLASLKSHWTSSFAIRKTKSFLPTYPANWRKCAACCQCLAWTKLRRPLCGCVTVLSKCWRLKLTRSAPALPAPLTSWATTWAL